MKRNSEFILLENITENTTGDDKDVQTFEFVTLHIVATDVSDGATVTLESSLDGVHYVALETVEIVENGVTEKVLTGVHKHIRASVSEYVDGTYSVFGLARG